MGAICGDYSCAQNTLGLGLGLGNVAMGHDSIQLMMGEISDSSGGRPLVDKSLALVSTVVDGLHG